MRLVLGPSLAPEPVGHTFYLVIERYRGLPFFPETTLDRADLEQVIEDLAAGQYDEPLEVVAFNPSEGWSRNVTEEIAAELQRRAEFAGEVLHGAAADFVGRNTQPDRQLSLRLAGWTIWMSPRAAAYRIQVTRARRLLRDFALDGKTRMMLLAAAHLYEDLAAEADKAEVIAASLDHGK